MKLLNNMNEHMIKCLKYYSQCVFLSFTLNCIVHIIPAVILGNYTDIFIQRIKKDKKLGDNILYYILLQTLIIIATLYLFLLFITVYTNDFVVTLYGEFFIVLYFSAQSDYIHMIKDYIITHIIN
jgi:flagellar biosynthesis component FlhA